LLPTPLLGFKINQSIKIKVFPKESMQINFTFLFDKKEMKDVECKFFQYEVKFLFQVDQMKNRQKNNLKIYIKIKE
jgi:hypothetical protein